MGYKFAANNLLSNSSVNLKNSVNISVKTNHRKMVL